MDDKDLTEIVHERPRRPDARMLFGTAGAIGAAAFLAACGDDDDSGRRRRCRGAATRRPARRHDGRQRERRPAAPAPRPVAAVAAATWPRCSGIDEASAGKGKTVELGAVLALTGTGSFYGKTMSRGLDLGGQAHRGARRPDVQVHVPRPQVGRRGRRRAGDGRARLARASRPSSRPYADDLGAMLVGPPRTRCSRSTAAAARASSARASRTSGAPGRSRRTTRCRACSSGSRRPTRTRRPSASSAGTSASRTTRIVKEDILKKIADGGLRASTASTSWCPSAARTSRRCCRRSRPTSPTSCSSATTARTPARSPTRRRRPASRRSASASSSPPTALNASKGTYDSDGYTFAYDYFDPTNPKSPLAKKFVEDFNADERRGPRLLRRQLLRERVRDVGGHAADLGEGPEAEITGEALDKALQENLTVVSVYGGDDSTLGTYTLDPNDALGDQARDGRVRVQGRHGDAEGVLRHRRRGRLRSRSGSVQGPTARRDRYQRPTVEGPSRCWRHFETFRQLTVDGFFRGCSYGSSGWASRSSSA